MSIQGNDGIDGGPGEQGPQGLSGPMKSLQVYRDFMGPVENLYVFSLYSRVVIVQQ